VSEDVRDTLDVSQVLTTSDDAYVKTDPQNMTTYDKEDGDVDGPVIVAATISEEVTVGADDSDADDADDTAVDSDSATDDEDGDDATVDTDSATDDADSTEESSETAETRIVCFASSSILDESLNNTVSDGNYTLYTNSLNWLVDSDEGTTVSIASKSMETQYLTVTAAKGAFFAILLCFLLPIACLIVGGVICYRRKRR
jgi:ABC-2 type transport system permease protein